MGNKMFIQNEEGALLNINSIRLIYICSVDFEKKIYGVKSMSKESKSLLRTGDKQYCQEFMNELNSKLCIEMTDDIIHNTYFEEDEDA